MVIHKWPCHRGPHLMSLSPWKLRLRLLLSAQVESRYASSASFSSFYTDRGSHIINKSTKRLKLSDGPTNAEKHVTSNVACAHSQQYTLRIMILCDFIQPNVISDGLTNMLPIHVYVNCEITI